MRLQINIGKYQMGDIILRNEIRTAKKLYYCAWCENTINPGTKYQYLYGGKEVFGKMSVLRYCLKCNNKEEVKGA